MRDYKEYTILDAVTPKTITSSTTATPIVVTKATHGLTTGDVVLIQAHATNTNANGIRRVTVLTANTFSLQDPYTGADIAGNGVGAGTGFFLSAPKVVLAEDFNHAIFQIETANTATTNIQIQGSLGKPLSAQVNGQTDSPIFGATVSSTNPTSPIGCYDLDNPSTGIAGSTGIAVTGTDINKTYQTNFDGFKYLTAFPVTWTAGAITIKGQFFSNR